MKDYLFKGHLLRHVDRFGNFTALRIELTSLYRPTGRSSIDPELKIRMRW
ncbi:hypothetical protein Z949_3412 [Sulfitobacter guttiformis KCTC 32187]|nr:hypothetical protein Z949_3412 [Sulfitobacter guttiformis KCTC 32187]